MSCLTKQVLSPWFGIIVNDEHSGPKLLVLNAI